MSEEDLTVLFIYEIEPLLDAKCLSCHGRDPDEIEGDYDLSTRKGLLRGGQSGRTAVQPGAPEDSPLVHAIKRLDPDLSMPPKDSEKLTKEEIEAFEAWISGGAPWPTEEQRRAIGNNPRWKGRNKVVVSTTGAITDSWANRTYRLEELWAYRPVSKPDIPEDKHPIDYLIEKKLDETGLTGAAIADRKTLIRRLFLNLTGLPPAPEQVQHFSEIDSNFMIEELVDHLLDSHHYGEQMARMWLDVVRYADSDGFSNDYVRPNAWRYRDYVIRSFNADKPYDQFVQEQIAGDEINPDDPEMLIATGFLRMGPWEHTSMSVAKETRQLFLDDVVNSVGETFLSTPLMCAKCHDHKFDPIPSMDYYSIQAVFATTQFADRPASFLPEENLTLIPEEKARIEEWISNTRKERDQIRNKEEAGARQWFEREGRPYLSKRERRSLPDHLQPPRYYGLTFADLGYRKVLNKRLQVLQLLSQRFEPLAYSVYNGPDRTLMSGRAFRVGTEPFDSVPRTFLLNAGSVFSPGPEVQPGVLQAVASVGIMEEEKSIYDIPDKVPAGRLGRRQAFAQWLVHPRHPITARSIVNRIWQLHFGSGLAEDPNNFGVSAKSPSHPELLDLLSGYLVENDWSIKKLHRLILTSRTFQRASRPSSAVDIANLDPDNHLYSYFSPRRMEAEEIRDAILLISGELNPEMGGIPIRPEINEEVALQPRHIMGSISQAYQPSRTPEERNRRTIYTERIRSLPNPYLSVLNRPGTELSCGRRSLSTIAPQALAMMNSHQMRNRSLALAQMLCQKHDDYSDRITNAIGRVWLREPEPDELTWCSHYLSDMLLYHEQNDFPARDRPTSVTRKMFEEMTGEPFEYKEELDIYINYVPDLEYDQVTPEVRALADLCLILFNSNEFLYVY